jgi:hypothetical protein
MSAFGDPTRAHERLRLVDVGEFSNAMNALFNPEQLSMSVGVSIGKLKPVGWSHPVKMYGSTGDWSVPLTLRFSQFAIWVHGYEHPSIKEAMAWLSQFCYPAGLGFAPAKLLVLWPNVLTMATVLEGMTITHTKFDKNLNARVTDVQLQLGEIRVGFKDAQLQTEKGFHKKSDNIGKLGGAPRLPLTGGTTTGRPLNLGGPKR